MYHAKGPEDFDLHTDLEYLVAALIMLVIKNN